MGFLDDVDPASTTLSADQVLNLRRSTEVTLWMNRTVAWSPVDPSKWYYTQSGTDARLETQCAFAYIGDLSDGQGASVQLGVLDIEGDIEFDGATNAAV